jgi:HK97 family phage major capsid protein
MPTLQELRDQRAVAYTTAQTYNERSNTGGDMTPEDETAWERALSEVDMLGVAIRNRETQVELDARFAAIDETTRDNGGPAGGDGGSIDDYRAAFRSWMQRGMTGLNDEQRSLIESSMVDLTGTGQRSLGTSPGSAGGYTVPETFWAKVTEAMKYFGGATNGAEVITTAGGNDMPWATNDDTANEGYFVGENVELTNEADLSFGQKVLSAYILASGPARLSLAVVNDSAIDLESLVARKMGERMARRANRAHTTGTGSSQPQGYMTALTTGKTTASATAITYDELIDLIHSVDGAYRATGRCRFKLHDLVLSYVRKIRDDSGGAGVGRPIWEPSIQAGVPDQLLGYGYDINNDQDSTVAATKKTLAFGDFQSAYVVRKVSDGQMMRLAERYAEYLQVGFIAYERIDGLVQDANAAKVLLQHA